jgi:hypothetical protein
MSANETQVGGDHYKSKAIQPWDYIASNNLGYLEGCIIKYISRHREKGGLEDLKKAQHFLAKLLEVEAQRATSAPPSVPLNELITGDTTFFGMHYSDGPEVVDWSAVDHAKQQEQKIVLKYVEPVKRGRGRPRKTPYGLKANGQPYVRRPRGFKEEQQ